MKKKSYTNDKQWITLLLKIYLELKEYRLLELNRIIEMMQVSNNYMFMKKRPIWNEVNEFSVGLIEKQKERNENIQFSAVIKQI